MLDISIHISISNFHFWEKSKVAKCQIWRVKWMVQLRDMFFYPKTSKWSVHYTLQHCRGEGIYCSGKFRDTLYEQYGEALKAPVSNDVGSLKVLVTFFGLGDPFDFHCKLWVVLEASSLIALSNIQSASAHQSKFPEPSS